MKFELVKCSDRVRTMNGISNLLNADVNGALNILRKVIGDAFLNDVANSGCWLHPVRIETLADPW